MEIYKKKDGTFAHRPTGVTHYLFHFRLADFLETMHEKARHKAEQFEQQKSQEEKASAEYWRKREKFYADVPQAAEVIFRHADPEDWGFMNGPIHPNVLADIHQEFQPELLELAGRLKIDPSEFKTNIDFGKVGTVKQALEERQRAGISISLEIPTVHVLLNGTSDRKKRH